VCAYEQEHPQEMIFKKIIKDAISLLSNVNEIAIFEIKRKLLSLYKMYKKYM
jgi:hypothetical protein